MCLDGHTGGVVVLVQVTSEHTSERPRWLHGSVNAVVGASLVP